jgi:hypothetical protein
VIVELTVMRYALPPQFEDTQSEVRHVAVVDVRYVDVAQTKSPILISKKMGSMTPKSVPLTRTSVFPASGPSAARAEFTTGAAGGHDKREWRENEGDEN